MSIFLLKTLPKTSKQSESFKEYMQEASSFFLLQNLAPQLRDILSPLSCSHPHAHTLGHYYIHVLLPDSCLNSYIFRVLRF